MPATASRKPTVEAFASRLDMARLAAVLKVCSNPRMCTIWQIHTASWLTLTLGVATPTEKGRTGYTVSLACIGEA